MTISGRLRVSAKAKVRPDHLFLGTHADNMKDMIKKDRHVKGSEHSTAKLTDEDSILIRGLYAEGLITQRRLAERFCVSKTLIRHVLIGKIWKHTL